MDWDAVRKSKWAPEPGPPEWPRHVRPISMEGLSLFEIGPDDGALYFDGRRIVFTRELKLTDTQKWQ